MGFTGSVFSMRSNLFGRCFAQNGPQDQENPLFQSLWPILGLKTAKSFQCAPLEGGTKPKRKKSENRCVFDANTYTVTKNKIFNMFFRFFSGPNFFGLETTKCFQCARPLQGPKAKTIAPFLTKTHFFKPQLKPKTESFNFFDYFCVKCFLSVGAWNFSNCPDPSKNQ